ncbi:MAG: TonB-dependent receptor, partial [Myxococcales bacterium]|nr:TonB-dependent receptor [Myxococcales bacterium]
SGGVFVLERVVADAFEMQWGARYDGQGTTATLTDANFASQTGTGRLDPERCEPGEGGQRCGFSFQAVSGSYGVLARVRPDAELRLDLSSAARMPYVDELLSNGSAPSFPAVVLGEPSLGVERTWGSSLTLATSGHWLATETSIFVNYVDDYIYLLPEGISETIRGPMPVFRYRPVDAVFHGGEHALALAPPRWPVSLDGQLAVVRALDVQTPGYLVFVPPGHYRLGLTYHWPELGRFRNGYVSAQGTYVDRQRRYDRTADLAPPPPAYFLLGAGRGPGVAGRSAALGGPRGPKPHQRPLPALREPASLLRRRARLGPAPAAEPRLRHLGARAPGARRARPPPRLTRPGGSGRSGARAGDQPGRSTCNWITDVGRWPRAMSDPTQRPSRPRRAILGLALLLGGGGCTSPEGDAHDHELEVITTVTLTLTPTGGGDAVVARFSDPDGAGGMSGSSEPLVLAAGTDYELRVAFLNELASPSEDITAEIEAEAEQHQVFFFGSGVAGPAAGDDPGALVVHAYADRESDYGPNTGDDLPVGLRSDVMAAVAGMGTLSVRLQHLPALNDVPQKVAGLAEDLAAGELLPGDADARVD